MTINQRIEQIRKYSGLSVNKFAEVVGISQPTAKAILEGENAPSFKAINGIAIGFPMISMEWLIREEGGMVKGTTEALQAAVSHSENVITDFNVVKRIINETVESVVAQALKEKGIA